MTYRLLLWRGRAGRDRKVLQQSYEGEEVLLQMKIIKEKKNPTNFTSPHEVCDLGFSLSSPSHSWINFQIDRAKSLLGPGTKFRASKVIQNIAVKNESPGDLYFHREPPPNEELVCLSVEEPWDKDLMGCREDKRASRCGVVTFHICWPPACSPGALGPSTFTHQRLSSVRLQRRLCEAKPRPSLPSTAAVQSSPAQVAAVLLWAAGGRGVQRCTAESQGERGA